MKVLFIDDDELRTRPLRQGLKEFCQFEVTYVRSPLEAIEKFRNQPDSFRAIVIDIMIPHLDIPEYKEFAIPEYFNNNYDGFYTGLKIYLNLQDLMNTNEISIPVIILTAIEDIKKYIDALTLKPAKIIIKPVYLTKFIEEINDATAIK
ncbi:MAG: response regulator transcription factor [candidate division Zixibacteria bacterium]|nr:response regulator transcription factor [candidate division Zixibacteria bacterium]